MKRKNNITELKPCACGNKNPILIYTGILTYCPPLYYLVGCYCCGNKTNFFSDKQTAIDAWNKRS